MKKILALIFAMLMLISVCVFAASCDQEKPTETTAATSATEKEDVTSTTSATTKPEEQTTAASGKNTETAIAAFELFRSELVRISSLGAHLDFFFCQISDKYISVHIVSFPNR